MKKKHFENIIKNHGIETAVSELKKEKPEFIITDLNDIKDSSESYEILKLLTVKSTSFPYLVASNLCFRRNPLKRICNIEDVEDLLEPDTEPELNLDEIIELVQCLDDEEKLQLLKETDLDPNDILHELDIDDIMDFVKYETDINDYINIEVNWD